MTPITSSTVIHIHVWFRRSFTAKMLNPQYFCLSLSGIILLQASENMLWGLILCKKLNMNMWHLFSVLIYFMFSCPKLNVNLLKWFPFIKSRNYLKWAAPSHVARARFTMITEPERADGGVYGAPTGDRSPLNSITRSRRTQHRSVWCCDTSTQT